MLIVAEKYRMAEKLAKILNFNHFKFPFFLNDDGDVLCYSQGHLFTLDHGQDDVYQWTQPHNFERLPRTLHLIPTEDYDIRVKGRKLSTGYLRDAIPKLMREHSVIVNACDADREGERIFYDLFNAANTEAQIYRLDLSRGITRSIVQRAYDNLFCATKTKARSYASQARNCADFAYALLTVVTTYYGRKSKLHPLLGGYTDSVASVVPVGRLIIPVLKIIADRSLEVEAITHRSVWLPTVEGTIAVKGSPVSVRFVYDYQRLGFAPSLLADQRLTSQYVSSKTLDNAFVIANVDHVTGVQSAPELFDTASMQAEMSHLSPSETLDVLQSLYEKGLITYPRTDASDIPDDEVSSSRLQSLFDSMQNNFSTVTDRTTKASTRFLEKQDSLLTNTNDTTASNSETKASHTALMPTNAQVDLSSLDANELNVYTKICDRLTQHLAGDTPVCTVVAHAKFRDDSLGMLGEEEPSFTFERVVKTRDDGTSGSRFLQFEVGDEISLTSITCESQPISVPDYYCESEIPLVMRNIGYTVESQEIRDILIASKGLGTAATRDNCVPSLLKRDLIEITIEDEKRKCIVTSKGLALLSVLPEDFVSPVTTALWESRFQQIEEAPDLEEAQRLRNAFIASIYQRIEQFITTLNRQHSTGSTPNCNVLPSSELQAEVKARARQLQKDIPAALLKSTQRCHNWLDQNPAPLHSSHKNQLEHSGLAMTSGVERDARRIAIRQRALSSASNNPPTQKALQTASHLANLVGCRIPAKAKTSAHECKAFIDDCRLKVKPTPEQVSALKKLAKEADIMVPHTVYVYRSKTKQMITKLRKKLGKV